MLRMCFDFLLNFIEPKGRLVGANPTSLNVFTLLRAA